MKNEYQVAVRNRFQELDEEEIDITWNKMKEVLQEVGERKLGFKRRERNGWYDAEFDELRRKRREA